MESISIIRFYAILWGIYNVNFVPILSGRR
jgi:hypothetical protein